MQSYARAAAKDAYSWAIEKGIAKEQARVVLPEGLTESTVIMAGSLRSWVHYCQLRMQWDTQKEHRIVAEQCWELIKQHFPDVVEACEGLVE
jgi:thymidylate synthase (FAD)